MDKGEAQEYLSSLLNKNFRVFTTDGRLFWGAFKCTDPDKNIVLANTYEYRQPSGVEAQRSLADSRDGSVALDMPSRYLGLVVVPGHHIVKMELEEFASQVKAPHPLSDFKLLSLPPLDLVIAGPSSGFCGPEICHFAFQNSLVHT
ncbi:hypothetical protein EsHS_00002373 [Epichloe bromicola]